MSEAMENPFCHTVRVRGHWSDGKSEALVRLRDLDDFHWDTRSGGDSFGGVSPRPFVYAYLPCDALLEGEVGHTCMDRAAPHRIKVCILKKRNQALFPMIEWRATRYQKVLAGCRGRE